MDSSWLSAQEEREAASGKRILRHSAALAGRKRGLQVTAVVLDRAGVPEAMTRDVHANGFTD